MLVESAVSKIDGYEVQELLGRGAYGQVFKAVQLLTRRQVAVKVFNQTHNEEFEEQFSKIRKEVVILTKLDSKYIVRAFALGHTADSKTFMVMEYISGKTLASLLKEHGVFSEQDVVRIAKEIATGLKEAHHAGVLHRDIKPSNVMLDDDGHVRILDFGIATVQAGTSLQTSHRIKGTLGYIDPEILEGKPADQLSDLYSLGCLMTELLTGRPDDRDLGQVQPELRKLILRMVNVIKPLRPESASKVIQALDQIQENQELSALPCEPKPNRRRLFFITTAIVLIGMFVSFMMLRQHVSHDKAVQVEKVAKVDMKKLMARVAELGGQPQELKVLLLDAYHRTKESRNKLGILLTLETKAAPVITSAELNELWKDLYDFNHNSHFAVANVSSNILQEMANRSSSDAEAIKYLDEAMKLRDLGEQSQGEILRTKARLFLKRNEIDKAEAYTKEAIAVFFKKYLRKPDPLAVPLAQARYDLSAIYLLKGEKDKAKKVLLEAREVLRPENFPVGQLERREAGKVTSLILSSGKYDDDENIDGRDLLFTEFKNRDIMNMQNMERHLKIIDAEIKRIDQGTVK